MHGTASSSRWKNLTTNLVVNLINNMNDEFSTVSVLKWRDRPGTTQVKASHIIHYFKLHDFHWNLTPPELRLTYQTGNDERISNEQESYTLVNIWLIGQPRNPNIISRMQQAIGRLLTIKLLIMRALSVKSWSRKITMMNVQHRKYCHGSRIVLFVNTTNTEMKAELKRNSKSHLEYDIELS